MNRLIKIILYLISYLVPRNGSIWIFGSSAGLRYNDNSRHLFEYVCKNLPAIRAIWLTRIPQLMIDLRRAGYESYLANTWKAYWLSCQAGVVISSSGMRDICYYAISRAKKINLWHGVPLKKIALDSPLKVAEKWDWLISTSPVISERMASGFGIDIKNVRITGYPRNDILLRNNVKSLSIIETLKEKLKAKKIILYAPTWRREKQDQIRFFETLDHKHFSKVLRNHDALLLIKMHNWNREIYSNVFSSETDSHICWLKEEDFPDFNYLLVYADVLITDYSGAYFDYLLLDRPIIFTPFDLNKYVSEWGLYENYDEATPGPKCFTWDAVMVQLQEILSGEDKYRESRKLALKKYHTFVDANSCGRVANYALELAKNRKLSLELTSEKL
jgi:CDP-glycerol glycerophosphotransferase (TagB/SpsB family)